MDRGAQISILKRLLRYVDTKTTAMADAPWRNEVSAYTSLERTVDTKAYGTIPVPVASVCSLTWFCARGDIHPRKAGYTLIGKLIVARYQAMTHR